MGPRHILYACFLTSAVFCLPRKQADDYRLPKIYVLDNYQIYLNVSANAFTASGSDFSGNVAINFTVTEDTDYIKLHVSYKDLKVDRVTVSGIDIDSLDYSIDEVTDIFTIFYPVGLVTGRSYLLSISFSGNLSEDMDGFYKSTYKDDEGTTRYLATTQFETISARRAFPCFDEPSFKATFDISITYPVGLTAISNTPGSIVSSDSVSETIQFETTPKMSTYLLAFVISDFTNVMTVAEDGVVHQVWSRDNTKTSRDWALEVGPKALKALAEFTGYSYAEVLKKMDQGAIPDFSAGAMENWGLVLYREGDILWNSENNSKSEQQNIATTITHEFSHQWFGDLVTLNWWSETFLNEGFATYCEFHIANQFLPEWELDKQFMFDVFQPILITDSYANAKALESEASSPQEIGEKFDGISYSKGGSVLRMVHHFLGFNNFQAGVQNYVCLNKFGNAIPANLWDALNEKVDNSIAKLPAELSVVMQNWTYSAGFPVLHVSRSGSQLTIRQERFLFSQNGGSDTKWYVPITYTNSLDEGKFIQTSPREWLTPDNDLTVIVPSKADWVIVNNQQSGYYRVNYDDALWVAIQEALLKEDFDGIGELNRAELVDDLFSFSRANLVEYSELLEFLEYLAHETSLLPWKAAFSGFEYLEGVVGPEVDIQAIILRLMTGLYASAPASTPNPDDQMYTVKRVLAADWACRLGNQDCIEYSQTSFAAFKNEGVKVDNDLKYIIYCNALRYGMDRSDYEFLLNIYQTASPAEQWFLAGSLACSPFQEVPQLLEQHLQKLLKDTSRPNLKQLKSAISTVLKQNPKMVDTVFKFVLDNHVALSQRYGKLNVPGKMLETIGQRLVSPEHVAKLNDAIQGDNLSKEFLSTVKSTLEVAETNLQWVERYQDKIKVYLKQKHNSC